MGSDVYGLPSRETYPDSQNLRSDTAKIRSIPISSKYFGTFFIARRFFLLSSSLFSVYFRTFALVLLLLRLNNQDNQKYGGKCV